jgi:Ca2+-binding RTX toxin-like protein
MATVSGGTAFPINFNTLQVAGLFDYDFSQTTSISAKYFDDANNYTLFGGAGFTFDPPGFPTGGTVTSAVYVVNGGVALSVGSVHVAATAIFDFAIHNDTQGLLDFVLSGGDTITGTPLADVIRGYGGNDTLKGGAGKDTLDGGAGVDTAIYADKTASIVVTLHGSANAAVKVGGVTEDTIVNIENVTGGSGADSLTGDGLANTLIGGAGNDVLKGGLGNDNLNGGAGLDKLTGGTGADRLTGGTQADTFIFTSTADSTVASTGRDTILDFSHTQADHIDLHLIDANSASIGNQAFHFIGTAAFGHHAGELHYALSGTSAVVSGDVNGDGTADFSILLSHVASLQAGDFVL